MKEMFEMKVQVFSFNSKVRHVRQEPLYFHTLIFRDPVSLLFHGLIPSVWHLFTGSVNMRSKEMPEQIRGGHPRLKTKIKWRKWSGQINYLVYSLRK